MLHLVLALAVLQSPDGAKVYDDHCAVCHAKNDPRTPTLAVLREKSADEILAALTGGKMREQGSDLTDADRHAVASYLGSRNADRGSRTAESAGRCAATPPFDPSSGPSWIGWSPDASNTRFQPRPGLASDQISKLTLKWAFGFPNTTTARALPAVAGGRVFVGSTSGIVYALDARSGCTVWTYQAKGPVRSGIVIAPRRGANGKYSAYFGDGRSNVYALDAATGEELWTRNVEEHKSANITGTPALYNDRLYVPVASSEEGQGGNAKYECCTFRGSLVALDAATGALVWKTYTITAEAKPVGQNAAGTTRWGPAGAGIWSSPTIDPVRKVVYVSTGNQYTEPQLTTSDSVVAIDLETGKIKWSSQRLEKDVWIVGCPSPATTGHNCNPNSSDIGPDYDLGDSPILTKLPSGKDVIIVGQKSGQGWALDPDRKGAVIWEYRAGRGTALGGIEWGPAVDGQNAYFAVSDFNLPNPGGLHAVNLTTGQRAWLTPAPPPICTPVGGGCSGVQSAAISVIPGIVFSGAMDGGLRAYSTTDGSVVWTFDANREFPTVNGVKGNGASFGGAGPSIAGGMLFVGSGYGSLAGRAGNVLLAFGVE